MTMTKQTIDDGRETILSHSGVEQAGLEPILHQFIFRHGELTGLPLLFQTLQNPCESMARHQAALLQIEFRHRESWYRPLSQLIQ